MEKLNISRNGQEYRLYYGDFFLVEFTSTANAEEVKEFFAKTYRQVSAQYRRRILADTAKLVKAQFTTAE